MSDIRRSAYRLPPSRRGKRQVIAYIDPKLANLALTHAHRYRKTIQEIIADALNSELKRRGYRAVLSSGHERVLRRREKASQVRKDLALNCPARIGKKSFSGWYYKHQVEELAKYAAQEGCSIQKLLEESLKAFFAGNSPSAGAGADENPDKTKEQASEKACS